MKNKKEIAILLTAAVAAGLATTTIVNKNNKIKDLELKNKNILEENEKGIKEKNEIIDELNKTLDEINKELDDIKKENDKLREELSHTVDLELTYYTTLPQENGGYTTTSIQTKLRHGVVASNYYPIGTKILIDNVVYTVEDRGSSAFDSPHRLDVLVEKNAGETNSEYLERINNMGRKKTKGKILK